MQKLSKQPSTKDQPRCSPATCTSTSSTEAMNRPERVNVGDSHPVRAPRAHTRDGQTLHVTDACLVQSRAVTSW